MLSTSLDQRADNGQSGQTHQQFEIVEDLDGVGQKRHKHTGFTKGKKKSKQRMNKTDGLPCSLIILGMTLVSHLRTMICLVWLRVASGSRITQTAYRYSKGSSDGIISVTVQSLSLKKKKKQEFSVMFIHV